VRYCLKFPDPTQKYITAFCAAISHCGHQQFISRLAANFVANKLASLDKPSLVETNFLRLLWIFFVCVTSAILRFPICVCLSICAWVATCVILFCGSAVSCRRTQLSMLHSRQLLSMNVIAFFKAIHARCVVSWITRCQSNTTDHLFIINSTCFGTAGHHKVGKNRR